MNISIALDAMGGDQGLSVVLPAAIEALNEDESLELILVGLESELQVAISRAGMAAHPRLRTLAASQVVAMDESPAVALRQKRDSSMRQALNLVKEGQAAACVSAGNTGALMATARFVLKMIPGVDRPAIISPLPTLKGMVHMLDLGANASCEAAHLLQFAVMGSVLAQAMHGIASPKVGLLNIGSESIKGSDLVKLAHVLLSEADNINYVGFIEGNDIYQGEVDVVVCDGFVGNVALKTSEGLSGIIFNLLKSELTKNMFRRLIGFLARPALRGLAKRFDPASYNGASFIGLRGIVIKSHGNASVAAFKAAIKAAKLEVERDVLSKITHQISLQLGSAPL